MTSETSIPVMSSSSSEKPQIQKPAKTFTIDLGSLWSPRKVPHEAEFKDPYKYNGDAYDRNEDMASQWEMIDP